MHFKGILEEKRSVDFHNLGRLNKEGRTKDSKVLKKNTLLLAKTSGFKADWRM